MVQTTPTDPAALARRPDTAGPLAVATPTTRKLADASLSVNTRRAYLGALARLDAWRGIAPVDDARLAAYLAHMFESGRAPATAALAVAAVRFRAKLAGQPDPAGAATARVLGGYRRTAADRGRGQAAPLRADGLAAILATAERPRTDGRGVESHTTAHRRGRLDAVIAGLLFMGGLTLSERFTPLSGTVGPPVITPDGPSHPPSGSPSAAAFGTTRQPRLPDRSTAFSSLRRARGDRPQVKNRPYVLYLAPPPRAGIDPVRPAVAAHGSRAGEDGRGRTLAVW